MGMGTLEDTAWSFFSWFWVFSECYSSCKQRRQRQQSLLDEVNNMKEVGDYTGLWKVGGI